jgi:hypothetical protein
MVVEPENGRVPVRPEAEAKKDYALTHLTDSWEYFTAWERCITRGVPAGIFPGFYGAGYEIIQSPGVVVIVYEMIHEARIIPLDGRPHIQSNIRHWNGDSRGRWDGNTLVVDVTNYNNKSSIATNLASQRMRGIGQSERLHVVERFTVVDANTIHYEATIDDPRPDELIDAMLPMIAEAQKYDSLSGGQTSDNIAWRDLDFEPHFSDDIGTRIPSIETQINTSILNACLEVQTAIGPWREPSGGVINTSDSNDRGLADEDAGSRLIADYDVIEPDSATISIDPLDTTRVPAAAGTRPEGRHVPKPKYRHVFSTLRRRLGQGLRPGR